MSFALWLSVSLDVGLVRSGEDFAVCKGSSQVSQALVICWMFEGVQYNTMRPTAKFGYLWESHAARGWALGTP